MTYSESAIPHDLMMDTPANGITYESNHDGASLIVSSGKSRRNDQANTYLLTEYSSAAFY
jgi:hypothetical protein